ncbi:MAG TPA: MATE family efflux transporter, partial [Candidatus Deferrimicrobium sp.]|nr:MATE family efflux transporter [Candidatus Deferrimicrobium sp.]
MATTVNKERTDYTEGSILYSIIMMGLPSMIGFLTQHIYSLVDMYWVSKLPQQEAAVAGITFFSNIMWLFFSFNQLVGPGSVAVISRRYGEREFDLAEKAIKETLVLKLAFGVLFAVAGYFSLDRMLRLIGAEGEALVQSIAYGRIMFLGMPVMFATYSVFTALRGVANPHQAMVLMIGSNVLNLVVAPFFIFGWLGLPAWGVRGAAFASVLCFTLTFLV